jgi:hypothetical protein
MSLLKPDIEYDPSKRIDMYIPTRNTAIVPEIEKTATVSSRDELHLHLLQFANNFTDAEILRFYKLSSMTFKTSVNVLDSISFLEKFSVLYIGALRKEFPSKDFSDIEKSLLTIKESIAEILKHDNVENKFIIPMMLGMIEGLLNYENY